MPNLKAATRRAALLCGVSVLLVALVDLARATEQAVVLEKNPPGDIPDDQVFITYASPLGFSLQVPQGWARTDRVDGVVFADKYGRIEVSLASGAGPTAKEAADAVKAEGRAVQIKKISTVNRPAGSALLIAFDCNSEPNAVTNKQIRLESDRYLFAAKGRLATVTFSAPKGADNVDQWLLMSKSFAWR
jgi:hypothetical protein